MLLAFERLGLLENTEVDELLWDCDEGSRKNYQLFVRTLTQPSVSPFHFALIAQRFTVAIAQSG
jgi:hypothetical protein